MSEEHLNKIWNAGKLFEPKPESEQPAKQPESEPKPSTVKRKKSVIGAFMDKQEDPFKEKVEAVLKGVEPAPVLSEPKDSAKAIAGKEEKPDSSDVEVIDGRGQHKIGNGLVAGKTICVEGDAGRWSGYYMSGGKIHVKGNTGTWTGYHMADGVLLIDGNVASFDETAFMPKNKGTIIWKGETIWEEGHRVEPGWTKLNVEEKIEE